MNRTLRWLYRFEGGIGWTSAAFVISLLVLAPLASLGWSALHGTTQHWSHLMNHVLPNATFNTLILLAGVGILVTCLGTGAAWLVTAYEFPGRRMLTWALLLPLAVPTYIIAFSYLDLMHPIGPVQEAIRWVFGYQSPREFRLPDMRSMLGAILLLGVVLYPYVYLSTRVMFMSQAANLIEAARCLGESPRGVFLRVALPLARPAIAVGVSLALLETLNDIGASEFLGIQTLTVAVYTTWVTRSDLAGAAQIAMTMLAVVVMLIVIERKSRDRQRYANTQRMRPMQPTRLTGLQAVIAGLLGWAPVVVGFMIPASYLLYETIKRINLVGSISRQLLLAGWNTLLVASAATLLTVVLGLVVAWSARRWRETRTPSLGQTCARISSLGYALPGTVLAIGLLTPLLLLDHGLGHLVTLVTGRSTELIMLGSMTGLVLAYTIRFLAISTGSFEAGLARIPASLEQAARLLGESTTGTLKRVHLPLLMPAIAAAGMLVFVDAMKELPATLMLRPMNMETLATWLYGEASRGTYEEGAVAALAIVIAGLAPVILLARTPQRIGRNTS